QSLSFSCHDMAQTGQLLARATSDVETPHRFVGVGFTQFLSALLMIIGSLIVLFTTNWQLALIMVVLIPVTFAVFGFFASKARPLITQIQRRLADLNTVRQENLASGVYANLYNSQFRRETAGG
ncbi:MAG: ABC transporter transmembrane domain-containing protein, partial [Anaerolineae bacterium]|nr:ABC transporter transmembrane domain-containing protein [Anaerolineae bacterium]